MTTCFVYSIFLGCSLTSLSVLEAGNTGTCNSTRNQLEVFSLNDTLAVGDRDIVIRAQILYGGNTEVEFQWSLLDQETKNPVHNICVSPINGKLSCERFSLLTSECRLKFIDARLLLGKHFLVQVKVAGNDFRREEYLNNTVTFSVPWEISMAKEMGPSRFICTPGDTYSQNLIKWTFFFPKRNITDEEIASCCGYNNSFTTQGNPSYMYIDVTECNIMANTCAITLKNYDEILTFPGNDFYIRCSNFHNAADGSRYLHVLSEGFDEKTGWSLGLSGHARLILGFLSGTVAILLCCSIFLAMYALRIRSRIKRGQ